MRPRTLAGLGVIALAAVACAGDDDDGGDTAAGGSGGGSDEVVTVSLGTQPWIGYGAWWIAQEQGIADVEEAVLISDRVYVMTPHPGRVAEVIDIPLPRPRDYEMLLTQEFVELKARIVKLIRSR